VARTSTTKQGKILVFAKSEEAKARLLVTTLRSGVALRQTKEKATRDNNFVIILGVNPTIGDKVISEELQRSCKRLVSTKLQGAATWKIKMQCNGNTEKASLIKSGVSIGVTHFKVVDYTTKQGVLQCYRCQGFGHIAASCNCEPKCQKCGGEHGRQECDVSEPKCANCGGAHTASSYECSRYVQEQVKSETVQMSYADKVKKGGDKTDCLRLACCIATTIATVVNRRLKHNVSTSDICKDVALSVAHFYKVNVRPEHVYTVGFLNRATTASQDTTHNGC